MRLGRTLGKIINRWRPSAEQQLAIRTQKAFATTALTIQQRGDIFAIRNSPGYAALLDLMEMTCIAQETNLVNAPVTEPANVLAEHALSKAFWQIFVSFQKKVEAECDAHLQIKSDEALRLRKQEMEEPDQSMNEVYSRAL